MLAFFIISLICSYGFSVILVEKRNDFPVKYFSLRIRAILRKAFGKNVSELPLCSVCTSFWAALLVDIVLFVLSGGSYFLWPLSGFAAAGFTWTVYEMFNILDKEYGI